MNKDFYKDNPDYDFLKTNKYLGSNIGYLTLAGSHAQGLNTKDSDIDVRGFFFENVRDLLSVNIPPKEQVEDRTTDTVVFSFRKFIKLCLNGNPSCLELLGTRDEDVLFMSPEAAWLRDNYKLFLSKNIYNPFKGFAGHLRKVYFGEKAKGNIAKANKTLMHCLRILYTGRDLFSKQELIVYRPEREFLLDVRSGNYSEEPLENPLLLDFLTTAKEEFELAYKTTDLPDEPDYKTVDYLQ